MRMRLLMTVVAVLGMSACGGRPARQPVSAADLMELATLYESVARAQIDAWNTHNLETIRAIYAEDAVHLDGSVRLEGLDSIAQMAEQMDSAFPAMEGRLGSVFTGRNDALDIWEIFGILTWTSDNPIIEYDLLEVRDGKVSSWRLYYDPDTRPFFTRSLEQDDLTNQILDNYTAAWSSGDSSAVGGLYATTAVREDTIFDERIESSEAIEAYAADWFGWYPSGTFELVASITERTTTDPIIGGVFTFRDGNACEVRLAILLDTSGPNITRERVYYDADTLLTCGWAS